MIKTTVGLLAVFDIITGTDVHLDKSYESSSIEMAIPSIPEYKPLRIPNSYLSVQDRYEPVTVTPKQIKKRKRK